MIASTRRLPRQDQDLIVSFRYRRPIATRRNVQALSDCVSPTGAADASKARRSRNGIRGPGWSPRKYSTLKIRICGQSTRSARCARTGAARRTQVQAGFRILPCGHLFPTESWERAADLADAGEIGTAFLARFASAAFFSGAPLRCAGPYGSKEGFLFSLLSRCKRPTFQPNRR